MLLKERFEITRPLEEMEIALVKGALDNPKLVDAHEEAVLRTALSLAKMYKVREGGRDVGVGAFLEPFRQEIERRLKPVLSAPKIERAQLMPHLKELKEKTLHTRQQLEKRFEGRLSPSAIDQELRHKSLVLVSGGGGGTGYVYVGVMSLLDEYGLKPELLVGTSMGAILSLFRSRVDRFDQEEILSIVRSLSWRKLFRVISTENKYGVPAALRLFLRAGIGRWFGADHPARPALKLRELPVKTIITVSGVRAGKLPRPLDWYEKLLNISPRSLVDPVGMARALAGSFGAVAELVNNPELLVKMHLGADDETKEFDALDAAGFSSALPGIIHYDVLRDDPHAHDLITSVMQRHRIGRFVDGGLVDNVPAKAAWRAVHKGFIGTRNAFILALNGFSMKLTTPLWLPLERLAEINVRRNRPWAHLMHDFKKTLSPLELVPDVHTLTGAVAMGRKALTPQMPFLSRMLAPLPRLRLSP